MKGTQSIQGTTLDESPLPINLSNLKSWILKTYRSERVSSRNTPAGSLTLSRSIRFLAPNLRNPVFAIGAPRSGTTFLGECLAQLPEISYHFEPVITKAAVRYVHQRTWSDYKARVLYRTTYKCLMRLSRKTDLRFCEKTPGNCFIMPFLYRTFEGARFIHIVRDGRDVALSLSQKPWYRNESRFSGARDPDGYYFGPSPRFWVEPNRTDEYLHTSDLHRCIWLWRRYVEAAFAGAAIIPPDRCLQVKYEELLAEPGLVADSISGFLGIENPHSRDLFRRAVVSNARSDSVGRWSVELSSSQKERLLNEAGALLSELQYEL
jgi:hypothetical protein